MNDLLIAVLAGVVVVIAVAVRWRGRSRYPELGFVSHQWVAEYRQSQQHDLSR
jgi:hypothetical protein